MNSYEIKKRTNGKYYFYLTAPNGMVLVTSQDYASKAACYNGIYSTQINAVTEKIKDETDKS